MKAQEMGLRGKSLFVYGFGMAGKWLSANIDAQVVGFIDTDQKKVGREFNGIPVLSVEKAAQRMDPDSEIIVTVVDIQDVVPQLKMLPARTWTALGVHLDKTKVFVNPTGESDQFVEYSLLSVENCHKAHAKEGGLFLRSVDLVITERCSLRCKDCSNLMQYYERPVNIEFDEVIRDFDNLTREPDHIHEVRLIGGEPFMNKDIYRILEYIVKSPKISLVVIYTNAMIPVRAVEADILRNPKIIFSVTDYGDLAKSTPRVVRGLEQLGLTLRRHPPENWTDSGTIHDFKRSLAENKQLFADCCGKNLLTVTDGRLYRCPFAANAERLRGVPLDPLNSVELTATKEAIRRYVFQIDFLPACNFCKGRSFGAPEIEPAVQAPTPIPYKKYVYLTPANN